MAVVKMPEQTRAELEAKLLEYYRDDYRFRRALIELGLLKKGNGEEDKLVIEDLRTAWVISIVWGISREKYYWEKNLEWRAAHREWTVREEWYEKEKK